MRELASIWIVIFIVLFTWNYVKGIIKQNKSYKFKKDDIVYLNMPYDEWKTCFICKEPNGEESLECEAIKFYHKMKEAKYKVIGRSLAEYLFDGDITNCYTVEVIEGEINGINTFPEKHLVKV